MADNRSSSSPPQKKKKVQRQIGTHNGQFHADEALACFMLKQLPEFKNAEIIRTRDYKILEDCDIVVDVGGVYDPVKNRFDHHQRTFNENFNSLDSKKSSVTKLSSAGLVYFHFGRQLISQTMEKSETDPITELIFDKVYERFIEEIDGIDNGLPIHQIDGRLNYRISTNLSSRVRKLNPDWNQPQNNRDELFEKAMELTGSELMERINYYKNTWLPARDIVLTAFNNRHNVDPSGEVMCFEKGGVPWKEHLFNLEEELKAETPVKYVLYQDLTGQWRVQCVPLQDGGFQNRLSLPEEWRGLQDDELSKKTGIKDCVFVHAGGFIGGNKTYEGVLKMAQKSLELNKVKK
ncbi:hypothetical protein LOTGIDRAFT_122169 [Lottia gigantea]|uniref:MYG1 protein n=1 Tax=Lottia gigantea TaxID=225164 RepID=V4A934_LOTGI|nr:hypothetical protein LOTGIDRAFT_122169 [Lottia gigantea]ESO91565.1 hypothetical protein LOTGIDRAFT_122169 [Lottia gigantea]